MGEESFLAILTVILLALLSLFLGILWIVFHLNKTRMKHQEEKQKLELAKREAMLSVSIETEENERQRIARELHDHVNNKLVILKQKLVASNEAIAYADELSAELDQTITTIRGISHALIPPGLERFGVSAAIEDLADELSTNSGLKVNHSLDKSAEPPDPHFHLSAFRIVQELVGNSLKHGAATEINIKLEKKEEKGILSYSDNGVGFDLTEAMNSKSLGLRNMESRAIHMKSTFELESALGEGMMFKLSWDL